MRQSKYLNYFKIFLVIAIIVPQVALAAWWNPFSWHWGWLNTIFHFQKEAQQGLQKQDISITERQKAENVVKDYILKTQNFDGEVGRIEGIKTKIIFSSGFFKDLWENELFIQEKTLEFGNLMLKAADELKKTNISAENNEFLDNQIKTIKQQQIDMHQSVSNLRIETLENDGTSAKVQANYIRSAKDSIGHQDINEEMVYVLNLIGENWKIVDLIDKDGAWSTTMDYKKERGEFMAQLNEKEANFNKLISDTKALSKTVADNNANNENKQVSLSVIWQENFETGSNWNGQRADIIMLNPGNAVVRITGAPKTDGYLFKTITVPKDAYYMTYEIKNEKAVQQSFLTVSFGSEIMDYHRLGISDNVIKTGNQIFFGDKAGKTDILTFELAQVGDESPSVLIDNIKFYKIEQ
jgi:hypothetical protein